MGPRKIAVMIGPGHGFNMGVLRGIARYAMANGPWEYYSEFPGWSVLAIRNLKVDGIIVPIRSEEQAQFIRDRGIPMVNCSAALKNPGVPTVRPDDRLAGRMAAEHLLERGFRNFAYCGFPEFDFSEVRRQGFQERLREAGIEATVFLPDTAIRAEWTWDRQENDIAQWLKTLPTPVGVMASMDERAWHVADACRRVGLRVPEDVAIVGVDNDEMRCEFTNPPLSSVAISAERIGYESAALLDRLMNGVPAPTEPVLVRPQGVVVRRSSDTLVIDDEAVIRAHQFIREYAANPFAAREVAREVGVERRDLDARFRRRLGRTLEEDILKARVGRATRMLSETDMELVDVAQAAGFRTVARLRDALRRETGLGPTEFHDKLRMK
jgi:LacI family transcriptional regulator